jgi:F-box protein 18 (helicase)
MIKHTNEQKQIIKSKYKQGDVIVIDAKAGSGKTSTIIETCKEWKENNIHESVLYLVYNTTMGKEAQEKMKKEGLDELVTVKTIHGLAYQYFGSQYRHKLGTSLFKTDVRNVLACNWDVAEEVVDELNMFFQSSTMHSKQLSREAKRYVKLMLDKDNTRVKMVHDCYLKLFHANCNETLGYDVILVDEAQDSNDITMDLVMNKISGNDTTKVFVGDPHQQIYSFRGSVNIMGMINYSKKFPLSKSFRFGKNIANLAGMIINEKIEGNENVCDRLHKEEIEFDDGQSVVISRTNADVMRSAFMYSRRGKKVHFLKGFSEYANDILDVCYLKRNDKEYIRNKKIKKFSSFNKYKSFCENASDGPGKVTCKMIEENGAKTVIDQIKKLKDQQVTIKKADVVVTNVHTSKGLEFENVILGKGFISMQKVAAMSFIGEEVKEEINLLYVAVTRAKNNLVMNESLNDWYGAPHIPFERKEDEIWA